MNRCHFLIVSISAFTAGGVLPIGVRGGQAPAAGDFQTILTGFLRSARATGDAYTVCDFPEGTKVERWA